MIKLLLPVFLFFMGVLLLKRMCKEKKTLAVSVSLLILSSLCFFLYLDGKIGVGLPSLLVDFLGKAG